MTLSEKLVELRAARGLSQGDLSEKLGVSRQSVSKWETGQSVPDLDKLIKLADLFCTTLDDLAREEGRPHPEQAAPQVVYVEKRRALTPLQIVGVAAVSLGAGLAVLGLLGAPLLVFGGAALVTLGLPLLLAKHHPLLIAGWLLTVGSWVVLNPWTSVVPFGLWGGVRLLISYCAAPAIQSPTLLLGICIALGRGVLTLGLLVLTWRAVRRRKCAGG